MGVELQHFAVISEAVGFGEGELLFGGGGVEGVIGSIQVDH